jgi:hypothetical protein
MNDRRNCQSWWSIALLLATVPAGFAQEWEQPAIPSLQEDFFVPSNEQPWTDEELVDPPAEATKTPASSISFGWLAPGGAMGFGIADFDAHTSWPLGQGFDSGVMITPGIGMHLWSGPELLDLPPRVYDLYLDVTWRMMQRERSGLSLGITPGYYGDFSRLDNKAFQFTGWLMGDWRINDYWTVLGGLAYVRQLKSNLLPVGGVVWQPHDDFRMELVFPRPRLARRLSSTPSHDTWAYVSGVFGGGAWAVDAGASNVLVQYSDLRLCAGLERLRTDGASWAVELGFVFSRNIAVDHFSVISPSPTALVQASWSF